MVLKLFINGIFLLLILLGCQSKLSDFCQFFLRNVFASLSHQAVNLSHYITVITFIFYLFHRYPGYKDSN